MELDTLWWDKRAQHAGDHSVQSMQEQECEFGDNIPAAVRILCHEEEGSYMAKHQLFTIATLAYKMGEMMEDGEQLEDWMETKLAQSEQSVIAVVKSYLYDEVEDTMKGTNGLDMGGLVIGT
jgi:hypothetical protein